MVFTQFCEWTFLKTKFMILEQKTSIYWGLLLFNICESSKYDVVSCFDLFNFGRIINDILINFDKFERNKFLKKDIWKFEEEEKKVEIDVVGKKSRTK